MRELKFRAWDKRNKKYIVPERLALYEDGSLDFYIYESGGYSLECFVIEQFTGLSDRNGKEIYEGDVVEYGAKNITTVRFEHGGFYPFAERYNDFGCPHGEDVVVIGNIHESNTEEVKK